MVLIQLSDRQYNNIHGLCNGKPVTNRPKRAERARTFAYRYIRLGLPVALGDPTVILKTLP